MIVIAVFYSKLCRAGISKFVKKLKKSVALTHNSRVPWRNPGGASFRSGLRKVLGIAYIRKIFKKKNFRRCGFPKERSRRANSQAPAPGWRATRAMRKPLGIAYVGNMFFPKTSFRSLFGKVSKLSGKFRNFFGSYYTRWAALVVACGKY